MGDVKSTGSLQLPLHYRYGDGVLRCNSISPSPLCSSARRQLEYVRVPYTSHNLTIQSNGRHGNASKWISNFKLQPTKRWRSSADKAFSRSCINAGIIGDSMQNVVVNHDKSSILSEAPIERGRRRSWNMNRLRWRDNDRWMMRHHGIGGATREITKYQLDEVRALFQLMDTDGSGLIDVNEIKSAFKLCHLPTDRQSLQRMFERIGRCIDDQVTFHEFTIMMMNDDFWMKRRNYNQTQNHSQDEKVSYDQLDDVRAEKRKRYRRHKVYADVFRLIDVNGGGTLDNNNILQAFHMLGVPIGIHDLNTYYSLIDKHVNDDLRLCEFTLLMETIHQSIGWELDVATDNDNDEYDVDLNKMMKVDEARRIERDRHLVDNNDIPLSFSLICSSFKRRSYLEYAIKTIETIHNHNDRIQLSRFNFDLNEYLRPQSPPQCVEDHLAAMPVI